MNRVPNSQLAPSDWVKRCTELIQLADGALSEKDATDLALQLYSFERTGAMPPEKAVDFVVSQFETHSPRFERRSPHRLVAIRAKK